jgi:CRP-like cAMP-binding protein
MLNELARLPMFRGVAVADLEMLLEHLEVARFEPGERVFEQGEEAAGALIVVQGQLEARIASDSTERVIGKIHPGELCGEAGFFQRQGKRNARVVAIRPSACLILRPESMQATLENPAMAAVEKHLVVSVARRIRLTNLDIQKVWKEQAAREAEDPPSEEGKKSLLGSLKSLLGGGR